MADIRKVFFSFHYGRDAVRAGQVRNSNVITSSSITTSEFIDGSKWEEVKRGGNDAIVSWINKQLEGTSVTVVLIGAKTSERQWVKFEIDKSIEKGNGLLGIYIHKCKIFDRSTDAQGVNPFDTLYFNRPDGTKQYLSEIYSTYDWIDNDGYNNLGDWIGKAAKDAGR